MIFRPSFVPRPAAIWRWFKLGLEPHPIHRGEWLLMRVFLAALVIYSLQSTRPYELEDQIAPVGLARFIDLSFLSKPGPITLEGFPVLNMPLGFRLKLHGPGWFDTITVLALVLGVLYTIGRGLWLILPMFTLLYTLPWTLSNSQGFDHHGYQLTGMVLVFQSAVACWWQWKKWRNKPLPYLPLASWLAYYSAGMIAFSYTVSAVTKIVNSKGLWLFKSHYLCSGIIKGHRNVQYENPANGPITDPEIVIWLLQHPWLTRGLFGAGFFLELFAFLALRNRTWSLLVGLSIISFHRCIWWLMRLEFGMHEWLVWIFLVNVPFWFWWACSGQWKSVKI